MINSDGPAEETPRRYRNPPVEHRFRCLWQSQGTTAQDTRAC